MLIVRKEGIFTLKRLRILKPCQGDVYAWPSQFRSGAEAEEMAITAKTFIAICFFSLPAALGGLEQRPQSVHVAPVHSRVLICTNWDQTLLAAYISRLLLTNPQPLIITHDSRPPTQCTRFCKVQVCTGFASGVLLEVRAVNCLSQETTAGQLLAFLGCTTTKPAAGFLHSVGRAPKCA